MGTVTLSLLWAQFPSVSQKCAENTVSHHGGHGGASFAMRLTVQVYFFTDSSCAVYRTLKSNDTLTFLYRPGLWHKAKKVTLTAGQTDIKVGLSLLACLSCSQLTFVSSHSLCRLFFFFS